VILHAGLIALPWAGRWRGVLLLGASGAGKSDLALRCLDLGFHLVADDRVVLWTSGDSLYGAPPDSLAGLVEARGIGILRSPYRAWARVSLAIDCVATGGVERLPDFQAFEALGRPIPKLPLAWQEASAPTKLRHALIGLGLPRRTA
jgi:serine kinase of HPr protein (carbohydrate metabolism regulator)